MLHIPVLRAGRPYRSLEQIELRHVGTGEPLARVSQANPGLIARDLSRAARARSALQSLTVRELLDICARAGRLMVEAELPVDADAGTTQSVDEYVRCQSSTTGLPEVMCRANMEKNRFVLGEMERILAGLTRGIDLEVLDRGWVETEGRTVSYLGEADVLGAVLPSNSPGVHSLWIPAIALKVALALKPGREEPWTPSRVCQALLAAGCPAEALGVYPTSYSGAAEILLRSHRAMLFGSAETVRGWDHDPRIQLHGPGWSKVILGEDVGSDWREHLNVMVSSVADNGGRSCINASSIRVTRHGREIAEALAAALVGIEARGLRDPAARLAAFPNPDVARAVSAHIDGLLAEGGAEDLTAPLRKGERLVQVDGCTFLLPTVIHCESADHPLASTELLFPFVSVVESPRSELLAQLGPTLVASAITEQGALRAELMASRDIDRLNLGPIPTTRVSWDQPHEGNLFEHLYHQRAFQSGPQATVPAA